MLFIGLHMNLVGLELTTSPSTLLLQGEEVPFDVQLIGIFTKKTFNVKIDGALINNQYFIRTSKTPRNRNFTTGSP